MTDTNDMTQDELRELAEKMGRAFVAMADALAERWQKFAEAGIDPNNCREMARDIIMQQTGLDNVRAANIVRLAIHKFNAKHGVQTYTPDDLRIICSRIAGG